MSRTRKSAWNLTSGLVFTLVTISIGVISTPLLLYWLGPEVFGSYRVMLELGSYLLLLELGLSGALYAKLALALGQNDRVLVEKLLATGMRFYLSVGCAMIVLGIALAPALPYLIRTSAIEARELRIAWLVLLVGTVLLPFTVYRLLVEAQQRSYLISLLLTTQAVITTGLLLVAAYGGWGLPGQSAATLLAQVPLTVILVLLGRRHFKVNRGAASDATVRESLKRLNWPTFAYNSSYRVGILGDTLFIGLLLGPATAVPFFLTQRLASLAQGQLFNVGNSTWAGLAELHAQGKREIFGARLLELTGFVSALSLTVLLPIVAFNRHFVVQWVGSSNFAGETLSVLICINSWLLAVFYLWGWALNGTGQITCWTRYAVAFIAINVAISIAGTLLLGIVGPPLGTLASCLLVTAWAMPRTLRNLFGLSPPLLWRQALAPLRWALPYAILLWFISHSHTPPGWLALIIEMGATGLGGLALWWMLGLTGEDRELWWSRLQEAVGR